MNEELKEQNIAYLCKKIIKAIDEQDSYDFVYENQVRRLAAKLAKLRNDESFMKELLYGRIDSYGRDSYVELNEIYEYAINVNYEIHFGDTLTNVFSLYKIHLFSLLDVVPSKISDNIKNIDKYNITDNSQENENLCNSLRVIFKDIANYIYDHYLKENYQNEYILINGKKMSLKENNPRNRIGAFIDLVSKDIEIDDNMQYNTQNLFSWFEKIEKTCQNGTHNDTFTKEMIIRLIANSYLVITEILEIISLYNNEKYKNVEELPFY